MVLLQDEPQGWVNTANLMLLGALRRHAPEAITLTDAGVVAQLDAFETALATLVRRH
jgi:hypothetical protein